jgi:hypothetical protein
VNNAHVVSKAYSGTGALKTDFARTGKRTEKGMMVDLYNSAAQYVKNNSVDGSRQDAPRNTPPGAPAPNGPASDGVDPCGHTTTRDPAPIICAGGMRAVDCGRELCEAGKGPVVVWQLRVATALLITASHFQLLQLLNGQNPQL